MNKIENKGWYDPNVQRRLGKKGGKVGGSRNTQTQWDARSKVGQAYGRSTGLANQSEALRNSLQSTLVFSHKKALDKLILVPPQQAVIEVARYINDQCDILGISDLKLDLNKVRSGGPFYGLLKKTKPSAYGWIILDQYKTEDLDD